MLRPVDRLSHLILFTAILLYWMKVWGTEKLGIVLGHTVDRAGTGLLTAGCPRAQDPPRRGGC